MMCIAPKAGVRLGLALVGVAAAGQVAVAGPTVCVPQATGVPTMSGPPTWVAWPSAGTVKSELDDPRWLGAVGHSYELGSAKAPLHTRALWANVGGAEYLYLSFIIDIEALVGATAGTPRDLFIGFRRATPLGTGELAHVFQFHLNADPSATPVAPAFCGNYASCESIPGTGMTTNYWRVFNGFGGTGECAATSSFGAKFVADPGAGAALPWMSDAVRFWKLDTTAAPLLQNRWAVQIRFPIAAAGQPLSAGIERGASLWYEATTRISGAGGGPYVSIGRWPRTLDRSICPVHDTDPNFLVHESLGDAASFSPLHLYSGAIPVGPLPDGTTCGRGLSIETGDIGAVFEAPAPATGALTTTFKALKPDGTPGTNTVVARVRNNGVAINEPLLARFRLANWGAGPLTGATWKDLRKVPSGACAAGAPPSCTPSALASGGTQVISFGWQLGDDPSLGASEYCMYGLTPPGGAACLPCSCAGAGALCDATTDTGTRTATGPCVSRRNNHQCMLVELTAPNGGVDFERQSAWNNMNFGQMSIMEREALIDARGLPVAQGQKEQDLYLIAMPRNMPGKLPVTMTGNDFVGKQAFAVAKRIIDPYRESYAQLPDEERRRLAERMKRRVPSPDELKQDRRSRAFGEDFIVLSMVRTIASPDDYARSGKLLELAGRAIDDRISAEQVTREIVEVAGASTAAEVVPTLEVYAFYRHLGKGRVYQPMTSFSVFLSHQGAMSGITWEIDGAQRVGYNVFRLQIPVGFARRIQVRSQALEPGELVQPPGNGAWPCGSGCCCRDRGLLSGLSNMAPAMLGLALFGRPRRKRKRDAERR